MTIKAIETNYRGYRFRSRLEARWAVFFDALGIRYEYEPQGFQVRPFYEEDGCGPWLYLPDFYLPDFGTWVEVKGTLEGLKSDYLDMIAWAVDWGGALPGIAESSGSTCGLLWLGSIPEVREDVTPGHVILQHSKGGRCRCIRFTEDGLAPSETLCVDETYFDASAGDADAVIREVLKECVYSDYWCFFGSPITPRLARAYRAARSARFEHGECP